MNRRDLLTGAIASVAGITLCQAESALQRGLWRDTRGSIGVGEFPEFGDKLFAFDYSELRSGPLSHSHDDSWEMASALDGSGSAVASMVVDGTDICIGQRRLAPIAIQRTPFTAKSKSIELSCEIATPASERLRGYVLMIYGSGPAPKEAFDLWAFWFLAEGFGVITYDKRGSGNSGGDWRLTGLEDLAQDAGAVLSRAGTLGVTGPVIAWGASQAGWILPQLGAAVVVDGIIMHAGSAMLPRDQIISAVTAELRAYEFPEDEVARAVAYYALDTQVSLGTRPWEEIDAAFKKASSEGAEWLLAPPAAPDAPERTMINLMANFNVEPYWRQNRTPILALYGGKDWVVPAQANLAALQKMVSSELALSATIIPAANHLMFMAETGVRAEYPKLSHLVPEYFTTISHWLLTQT